MADINHSMQTFESYLDTGYDQVHRPQFHFTSRKNWLNDPNGLIYCYGVYHIIFTNRFLSNTFVRASAARGGRVRLLD